LRAGYRGKADLDRPLPIALPATLLRALQEMLNTALAKADTNVETHVEHDPFHLDYVDADEANAIAFCDGSYSFIGITLPQLDLLWSVAEKLSFSEKLKGQLPMSLTSEQLRDMSIEQRIQVVIFRLGMFLVVLHEFTHIVHGHVGRTIYNEFSNHAVGDSELRLAAQIREADADGYGVYFLLANLIDGEEHSFITHVLGIDKESSDARDQLLLLCFIASAAGFFFTMPHTALNETNVYSFGHPPQAARMRLITQAILSWSRQNRLHLKEWTTQERYELIMDPIAGAIWGANGGADWNQQVDFLRSEPGKIYTRRLGEGLDAYVAALPTRSIAVEPHT
jgi:hypothetical protein